MDYNKEELIDNSSVKMDESGFHVNSSSKICQVKVDKDFAEKSRDFTYLIRTIDRFFQ